MSTPRLRGILVFLTLLPLVSLLGCGSSSKDGTNLVSISLSPTSRTLYPGQSQQLVVTAHYSDGTSSQATSGISFTASVPAVATVSSAGVVTGVGLGTGTVSAAIGDKSADAVVSVTPLFPGPVFTDALATGVTYLPFSGSQDPQLAVDSVEAPHAGSASLRITTPAGNWVGGTLMAPAPQNLSAYNALTFWAKASQVAQLDKAGYGASDLDARYKVELASLPLTTSWNKYIIPLPAPAKVTDNAALFHFATWTASSLTIWLDDIQYETLPAAEVGAPTAASVAWGSIFVDIGKTMPLPAGNTVTFAVPSVQLVNVGIQYFDVASDATSTALVTNDGQVKGIAYGTAHLTASLGGLSVPNAGSVTVAPSAPLSAPPRPTLPQSEVISLLSAAYANVPVNTWNTSWGVVGSFAEVTIGGDPMKKYAQLGYAGIEFTGTNEIDATQMGYFHIDFWTPDMTEFHVKLVDFGADTIYSPNVDDTAFEYVIHVPPSSLRQWVSVDVPLSDFPGMNFGHLAQMIPVGVPYQQGTVYIDNVYFHK